MAPIALRGRSSSGGATRSRQEYVTEGVGKVCNWLRDDTTGGRWRLFGPYWPLVQALVKQHQPADHSLVDWGDPPPELSRYTYGDDFLNLLAALAYLDKEGDYLDPTAGHSIELPNGDRAMYYPGIGVVES